MTMAAHQGDDNIKLEMKCHRLVVNLTFLIEPVAFLLSHHPIKLGQMQS
jgi:hypothetical protein